MTNLTDPVELTQQLIACCSVTPNDGGAQDLALLYTGPLMAPPPMGRCQTSWLFAAPEGRHIWHLRGTAMSSHPALAGKATPLHLKSAEHFYTVEALSI